MKKYISNTKRLLKDKFNEKDTQKSEGSFYTQTALCGFVKLYWLIFSLLESSKTAAETVKTFLTEEDIATLVCISVSAPAPI